MRDRGCNICALGSLGCFKVSQKKRIVCQQPPEGKMPLKWARPSQPNVAARSRRPRTPAPANSSTSSTYCASLRRIPYRSRPR